jgi:hypothetical protein
VPIACEKAGLKPDFHLKTLHSPNYWSFNPHGEKWEPFHVGGKKDTENVWCTQPQETVEFMRNVTTPWIAFKVLAAGAIPPQTAFQYAYENGADFICAGMFDFQVREDTIIAKNVLNGSVACQHPWRAELASHASPLWSSAFICGSGSFLCGFPPQARIVLPFENPPEVLRAVFRLAHEVPAGIQECLGCLRLSGGLADAARTLDLA